jgi:hypothetical protein
MDGDVCGLVCCGDVGEPTRLSYTAHWSMASWMYEVFNDSAVVFAFVPQCRYPYLSPVYA